MPHLAFTVLVAVLLSTALALLEDRSRRERVDVAIYLLLCCAVTTLAGTWVMRLIHG
jgi:hypothetical protein